ncbi:MAG TPA: Bax inhibitor-1/YccA family protein [Candidatus Saccharimonadales bacterium]|nr:Bax inhibitor-1/YccA family protein [Candidatus Saccharimonadales bacterium]
MSDQRLSNPTTTPNTLDPTAAAPTLDVKASAAFLSQAFLWMFAGLLVSAGVSFWVTQSAQLMAFAAENLFILFMAQLALVFVIGLGINKISATAALGLFFVYAASLGLTIGLIVAQYEGASVAAAFLSASAMFGAAAIYGAVTKRSLAGLGGILLMGLIGLIVASLINIFLASDSLSWIISIVGVVIFTALTAYDVQRIQQGDLVRMYGSVEKAAVIGALRLYLDFINIFLFMLRLFGGRN